MSTTLKFMTTLAAMIILLVIVVLSNSIIAEKKSIRSDNATAQLERNNNPIAQAAISEPTNSLATLQTEEGQLEDISAVDVENAESINTTADAQLSEVAQLADFQMMNPQSLPVSTNQTEQAFVTTQSAVDWQAASQHKKLPADLLSTIQNTSVGASKVPVLLPNNTELLDDAIVSVGSDWYAASMNSGEVNVMVDGSSVTVGIPTTEPKQPIGLGNFSDNIVKSLGMIEVSFSAYGVNYNVVVECFSHETDPACLESDFIHSIVDNLLLAEGDNNEDGA